MLLVQAFFEGGVPMYPILAIGVLSIVTAVRCARHNSRRHLLVRELRALTLLGGCLGSILGVVHTFAAMATVPGEERTLLMAKGISESVNNMGLAVILAIIATAIVAIGHSRGGELTPTPDVVE